MHANGKMASATTIFDCSWVFSKIVKKEDR